MIALGHFEHVEKISFDRSICRIKVNSAPFELRLLDLMPNRWNILSMDQAATQQVALATNGFIDECICEVTRLSHISKFRNRVWRNGLPLPLPGGRLFLSMGRTIESGPSRPPFGGGTGFAPFTATSLKKHKRPIAIAIGRFVVGRAGFEPT
jgi:hypothetical protein